MSTRSPREVVEAHLHAFSTADLPTMLATMAPGASFTSGRTHVRPEEFAEFFGRAMREIDPLITVTRLVVDGGHVACEFRESVILDGQRQHLERAAFYVVDDGLITSVRVYDERG